MNQLVCSRMTRINSLAGPPRYGWGGLVQLASSSLEDCLVCLQALDVTAEADAQATVSENRPAHPRHGAAFKWPAIVGLISGSLILLFVLARFWRRRSRRMLTWLGLSRFAVFTSFTSARDTGNGSSSAELGVVSPPAGLGPLTARHTKRVSRLPDLAAEPMFGVSHEASHLPEGAPIFKPRV